MGVTTKLICVGGPLAGKAYDVDLSTGQGYFKLPVLEDDPDPAPLSQDVMPVADDPVPYATYRVEYVVFGGRTFWALVQPDVLRKAGVFQTELIVRAFCTPAAIECWEAGRAR